MNGTEKHDSEAGQKQNSDALTELFRHVATRRRAPHEDEQLIRQALYEQWQELTRHRRRRRMIWAGAIAASVALSIMIATRMNPDPAPAGFERPVAVAEKVIGTVMARSGARSMALREPAAQNLQVGQTLQTEVESGLALHWINGALIRVDELTELELSSSGEVNLVSGRIYLDTAFYDASMSPLTIRTPQGLVKHVGTLFMTRVSSNGTSVSVREGEVMYLPPVGGRASGSDEETIAGVGQQLEIFADGAVEMKPVSTWDSSWEWAETLAPGFQSDGRSLSELLAWVGRESGRQVQYDSPDAEAMANTTVLHGNLDVEPMRALAVATATSDLKAEVNDGLIMVSVSQPELD